MEKINELFNSTYNLLKTYPYVDASQILNFINCDEKFKMLYIKLYYCRSLIMANVDVNDLLENDRYALIDNVNKLEMLIREL